MIINEKQASITKKRIAEFNQAIAQANTKRVSKDQEFSKAKYVEGLESLRDSMKEELRVYECLKNGDESVIRYEKMEDLPHVILQYRILRKMSQTELAKKLGVKPQQVQRWEALKNSNTSFPYLAAMARILNVPIVLKKSNSGAQAINMDMARLWALAQKLGSIADHVSVVNAYNEIQRKVSESEDVFHIQNWRVIDKGLSMRNIYTDDTHHFAKVASSVGPTKPKEIIFH